MQKLIDFFTIENIPTIVCGLFSFGFALIALLAYFDVLTK